MPDRGFLVLYTFAKKGPQIPLGDENTMFMIREDYWLKSPWTSVRSTTVKQLDSAGA